MGELQQKTASVCAAAAAVTWLLRWLALTPASADQTSLGVVTSGTPKNRLDHEAQQDKTR
jgi:hypothetical protein